MEAPQQQYCCTLSMRLPSICYCWHFVFSHLLCADLIECWEMPRSTWTMHLTLLVLRSPFHQWALPLLHSTIWASAFLCLFHCSSYGCHYPVPLLQFLFSHYICFLAEPLFSSPVIYPFLPSLSLATRLHFFPYTAYTPYCISSTTFISIFNFLSISSCSSCPVNPWTMNTINHSSPGHKGYLRKAK